MGDFSVGEKMLRGDEVILTDQEGGLERLNNIAQFKNGLMFVCIAFFLFIQSTRWTIL